MVGSAAVVHFSVRPGDARWLYLCRADCRRTYHPAQPVSRPDFPAELRHQFYYRYVADGLDDLPAALFAGGERFNAVAGRDAAAAADGCVAGQFDHQRTVDQSHRSLPYLPDYWHAVEFYRHGVAGTGAGGTKLGIDEADGRGDLGRDAVSFDWWFDRRGDVWRNFHPCSTQPASGADPRGYRTSPFTRRAGRSAIAPGHPG